MKLIFAQGNPGRQYARSRHNAGFLVLDRFAAKAGAAWKTSAKFDADIAELTADGQKVLLVKPNSFYNDTGAVVRALVDFYKLDPATDLLVIHDDLALPFGTVRTRQGGSDAGNNGIKSINAHLGPGYARVRIGIWNDRRDRMDDAAFVLATFDLDESTTLDDRSDQVIMPAIRAFLNGTLEHTTTRS